MTKLLKKLLSGVLSMVLLASSVSVAVATDNYEQYLPIITRLEQGTVDGSYYCTIPFDNDNYSYAFQYIENAAWGLENYYEANQEYWKPISFYGHITGGKYPIISQLLSLPDSDGFSKLVASKETGFYVDIKVLPPLETQDIEFNKMQGEQDICWLADLGSGYSSGRYVMYDKTNIDIYCEQVLFPEKDSLELIINNLPTNTYTIPKQNVILQRIRCTGISSDGKTIYMEVTQAQDDNNFELTDYIYDQTDTGESLTIPNINDVTSETEAINKVQNTVNQATEEEKNSATGIDKLTLLAEEASAKANTVKLTDNNISVTAQNISERTALQSTTNVLTSANIQMQRKARNIVNYDLGNAETVNIKTEDVSNKVDAVRVSTSYASATVNANTASDFTMTNKGEKTVEINFNKDTDTTVTISFQNMNANDKYYAVVDENGNPVGGKYNPATGTLEAKLTESGIYKVVNNEKDFADIKDKSAEMQEAIKVLASKGIINGTTATTFAPDSTISRAEVTALLMRTISLLDPNANGNFADVSTSNWYCGAAGSAKEHNIINGYEDNTFRGNAVIAKDQIVAVSARTLKQQMNYKTPSDVAGELSVYADANNIASWAKEDVALATMTNLVLKRTDSTFSGADGMTRGDAAIIMQRLFNKLW